MKRIVCSLCGGTGISYEVSDPLDLCTTKTVAALEKKYQLNLLPTPEEEGAWNDLEKRELQRLL